MMGDGMVEAGVEVEDEGSWVVVWVAVGAVVVAGTLCLVVGAASMRIPFTVAME